VDNFIGYPKINEFRSAFEKVKNLHKVEGLSLETLPKIQFLGEVKVHGTNSAICYNPKYGIWTQSRNKITTPQLDNFGFSKWVYDRESLITKMMNDHYKKYKVPSGSTLCVYGEWAGEGVFNSVKIGEHEKSLYVFNVYQYSNNGLFYEDLKALCTEMFKPSVQGIYSIRSFKTFRVTIDFEDVEPGLKECAKVTEGIDASCPVAMKILNESGIGEGVVWKGSYLGEHVWFKTKGESYLGSSRKKVKIPISAEKKNSIDEFVAYAIRFRMDQAINEVFKEKQPCIEKIGEVIKWVSNDTFSEELDVLKVSGLTWKDVKKPLDSQVANVFKASLDFFGLIDWYSNF